MFAVDAVSGQVTVAAPLDYETAPLHRLNVTARDSALLPRAAWRVLTVTVTVSTTLRQLVCAGSVAKDRK